ncbi:hypothetical protein Taro_043976 [Colocasia esculenta]|uniref:Uncharacterized protein n=1 Tax=Colocasia esculenta TaxID=4460 RepID=A0A843X1S4_COLES|nr:hypothetical protein [Colocasia esculenta]
MFPQDCVVLVSCCCGAALEVEVHRLVALCSGEVFPEPFAIVLNGALVVLVEVLPRITLLSLLVEVLPRSALCSFWATVVLPLWFEVCHLVGLRSGEVLPGRLLALLVEACGPLRVAFGGSLVRSPSRQAVVLFRLLVHLYCTLLSFGACGSAVCSCSSVAPSVVRQALVVACVRASLSLWERVCLVVVPYFSLGPSEVGVLSSTSAVVSVPVWLRIFAVVGTLVPAPSPVCAWRVCCQRSLVLQVCVVLEVSGSGLTSDVFRVSVAVCHVVEHILRERDVALVLVARVASWLG